MKRVIAIFLCAMMIFPLCVFSNAAENDGAIKPFRISNSADLDTDFDNFYPKIHFWSRASDEYVSDDSITVSAPGVGGKTATEIAENLKPVFDAYPDGMRYLRFTALRAAMVYHLEDTIFMEKGIQVMKDWFTEFIYHYKEIGGKFDGVVADVEYFEGFAYYVNRDAKKDPMLYHNIVTNPNYATKIRPALEERGFKFWPDVTETTPEIYGLDTSTGDEYAASRNIWDVVIRNHYNQYVNDVFLESLLDCYPDAVLTDYQARDTYAWLKMPGDQGTLSKGGNYYTAGNVNYFNTYAARPSTGFFKEGVYKKVPAYNNAVYEDNPFNMVLWESNFAKNLKKSAPDGRLTVTVTFYTYSSRKGCYCNTPYYSEMIYHMGMLDPDPFQSYCIGSEIENKGSVIDESVQIISELLNELTRVAGAADRKHIPMPYSWNDKFILTGMYAGGRNIWRITPDLTGDMTLGKFKVDGAQELTFSIEGQTVTFPKGKIIEDSEITQAGTCGYWVETPKDVLPVITYQENRYEEYPAFEEDFGAYEAGASFDATTASPVGCWEMKKTSTSSGKVVADGENKVLAVRGTYSLRLKDILENITAGDTYAKNQAWSVDVTVPADMDAEAEIRLLGIYPEKTNTDDGGFRIAGGKLYYSNAGTYEEFLDVDVSAGGKFKLVRSMNFHNPQAITCDYLAYNAEGKLLGQVKDVPVQTVALPVQKIGMSTSKVSGEPVLLDNFKIYANGLAADFELYNAKTGIEYTDLETAKDTNTAYRLSWMNGTAYEKAYSVVAAFYNGDTLVSEKVIEEIKMAPGTDAVATGIVEVAEGQSVRIYARNDSQPEPEVDNSGTPGEENPGDGTKGEPSVMLIAIIAGAVVLVALIVVIIVVLGKKTAPAAEEKTEETTEEKTEE